MRGSLLAYGWDYNRGCIRDDDFANNMRQSEKIYIAGHRGLAGSAILRHLQSLGYENIVTRTHDELDLARKDSVADFFAMEKPDYVFLAAARVGGILANNTYPAEFILSNLEIQTNVIHEAWKAGVKRLLFLGSSCIYPRDCPQPMKEEYLLTGPLEATNRPYAIAKIAGIEMCWAYNRQHGTRFLAAMPTNLYGPGDNYDLQNSHVLPALIRKIHEAKEQGNAEVVVWGTGTPRREFLHADDMAAACAFLMSLTNDRFDVLVHSETSAPLINIGCGEDQSIRELAETVSQVVGYEGRLRYDASKPDGTPRKLLDVGRLNMLGWRYGIGIQDGIARTYRSFLDSIANASG
jgi:GDP-L-fucose synthase